MRQIKFRAWDGEQMIESYELGIGKFFEMCDGNYEDFKQTENIMQFTGLLDKNGKEIYEGDIVKLTSGGYGNIYEVRFEFGCFYAGWHNGSSTAVRPKLIKSKYTEIIGNIYENPEFLTNNN